MELPDYHGGSIVSLTCSVERALVARPYMGVHGGVSAAEMHVPLIVAAA